MAKKHKMALASGLLKLYALCTGRRYGPALKPALAGTAFKCIAIYSTTALGDLMFNTPAIRQLRLRYPQARLLLIVHQKYVELVQGYTDVDEVLCWDGRVNRCLALARQLKQRQADLAVILHSRAPYDVLSAVLGGVRVIVRDENYSTGQPIPMQSWLAAAAQASFPGHVIQRKLALLSHLGCRTDQLDMIAPVKANAGRYAESGKVRIGFQLGASTAERCWPVEHFAALATSLLADHPERQIVLMGLAQEAILAERFLACLPVALHGQVQSMIGQTTVAEAFDLVASLTLLVTGDTGPLHLAVALQVASVSLFVSANPGWTGPLQDPHLHRVIYHPLADNASHALLAAPMLNIGVAEVLAAVEAQLGLTAGVC